MDDRPPEHRPTREDRVRELGFDPCYLTPQEQVDLLEIHAFAPDATPLPVGRDPELPLSRYS